MLEVLKREKCTLRMAWPSPRDVADPKVLPQALVIACWGDWSFPYSPGVHQDSTLSLSLSIPSCTWPSPAPELTSSACPASACRPGPPQQQQRAAEARPPPGQWVLRGAAPRPPRSSRHDSPGHSGMSLGRPRWRSPRAGCMSRCCRAQPPAPLLCSGVPRRALHAPGGQGLPTGWGWAAEAGVQLWMRLVSVLLRGTFLMCHCRHLCPHLHRGTWRDGHRSAETQVRPRSQTGGDWAGCPVPRTPARPGCGQALTVRLIGAVGTVGAPVTDLLSGNAALEVGAGLERGRARGCQRTRCPMHQVVSGRAAALPPGRVGQAELGTAPIALCTAIGACQNSAGR